MGLAGLVLTWLLFVAVNCATDRGTLERLLLRGEAYGDLLAAMAEFDRKGGRVQEIGSHGKQVRRAIGLHLVTPFALIGVLLVLQHLLGFPRAVVAGLVGAGVFMAGTLTWAISGLLSGVADAEGDRTAGQTAGITSAAVIKAALATASVLVGWQAVEGLNEGRWATGLILTLVSYLFATYCYLPVVWVDRWSRRRAQVQFSEHTATDAVLFLRSFADDDFRLFTPWAAIGPRYRYVPGRKRFEEFLAACVHSSGRLIGVGRPGERLPALGASRSYWAEDDWRTAIQRTASRAKALIVMAGRTPSLAWEMTQLIEFGLTSKTLILFPPDHIDGTDERHRFIASALNVEPDRLLPDDLLISLTAVAFDNEQQPIYYLGPGRDWVSYLATVAHFFVTVEDRTAHDAAGTMAAAVDITEDPFNQAAYLLTRRGGREAALELVSDAPADESPMTRVGAAWAQAELHRDLDEARSLLERAVAGDPEDDLLQRAMAVLNEVENGRQPTRALLHTRYPTGLRSRPNDLICGTARMPVRPRGAFVMARARINAARTDCDYSTMLALALKARDAVSVHGLATAVAYLDNQVAQALVGLGRHDEARERYLRTSQLAGAPRTEIAHGMPWIDPRDVVDDALVGLRTMAASKTGPDEDVVAVAERLRHFRITQGLREKAAESAYWLAERHLHRGRPDEAISWGQIAHAEFARLGHKTDTGRAAVIVAEASNKAEAWDSAATWASRAKADAHVAGDHDVAQWAQFEAARADRGLGNDDAAADTFEAIFRSEIHGNRWRARASMIRLGEIDTRRAVPLARLAAAQNPEFYGPQAAVRLAGAARAENDELKSSTLWKEAVDVASTALVFEGITADDAGCAWSAVVESVARASEDLYPALVAAVATKVPAMQLVALGRLDQYLSGVAQTGRFDALADVAGPVSDRYESLLADLASPTVTQLNVLTEFLWSLARGLRESGAARSEVIEVDERLVGYARRVLARDAVRGPSLARCLIKYGYDLGQSDRQREGVVALSEGVGLLDKSHARGTERWADLCQALTIRADLAGDYGDTATRTADLQRAQSIIDVHRSAGWATGAQRWLDRVTNSTGDHEG